MTRSYIIYNDEFWPAVAAELATPAGTLDHRLTRDLLEILGLRYRWVHEYISKDPIRIALYQKIGVHCEKLSNDLDQLKSLENLNWMSPGPDSGYRNFGQTLAKLRAAVIATDHRPVKKSNRSRSALLDNYLRHLLLFWISRGGYPGKAPTSPAVRFILAAAKPLIPDLTANAVSHFIRSQPPHVLGVVTGTRLSFSNLKLYYQPAWPLGDVTRL